MNTEYTQKINRIAIVDDNPANRIAAIAAIKELLPHCTIVEFSNAADAVAAIDSPIETSLQPDFVLSDMCMEEERSGWKVATAAWAWRIPTTIVSGGIKGHGKDSVILGYPECYFPGEKDDPDIWKQVIVKALSGEPKNNALLTALKLGKLDSPEEQFGGVSSVVVVGSVILRKAHK